MRVRFMIAFVATLTGASSCWGQIPAGSAFTYQGQLKSAGVAYSGSADIQFSLWDAATSPPGVQVGMTQIAANVNIANGLFTQSVDFGALRFDGHARWLQVAVRTPSGSGAYTTLTPRQSVTPAPYAASLALPTVSVSDSGSDDAFTIVQNGSSYSAGVFAITSTTSFAAALRASHMGNGPAVAGVNQHAGTNFGWLGTPSCAVYGSSQSLDGVGVYGSSTNGKFGVYGTSPAPTGLANSLVGAAVLGDSTTLDGVTGIAGAASRSGVSGYAQDPGGGGVYGKNNSTNTYGIVGGTSYGVFGQSPTSAGRALWGYASATSGQSYGVYGETASSGGAGVYGTSGSGVGVIGNSTSADGVTGFCSSAGRSGVSGYAQNAGSGGVYGINLATNNYGVVGSFGDGVYGLSVNGGHGVAGYSTATSGQNSGVHGETSSPAGFGVYGTLPTRSGIPLPGTGGGVMGDSGSGDGVVGFSSALSGVYGLSSAPGGAGLYGINYQTQNFGALGTPGAGGYGVAVAAGGTGLFGQAFGSSGANYGVYGRSDSPDGYGGYFIGRGYFSDSVGINVQQPAVPLQVAGGTDATLSGGGNIVVGQVGGANLVMDNNEIMARNNGAAANLTLNNNSGSVGIGRNPVSNKLEVEGNASKTAAGSWLANSDARIKTDVQEISNAMDALDRVRLVNFRYTDEYRQRHPSLEDRRYLNVIAQEFAQVFPEYVKGSGECLPDGSEILQVDTYPLTIYTAAAVQELHRAFLRKDSQIAAQTQQLAELRREKDSEIADLRTRLARIEKALEANASVNGTH